MNFAEVEREVAKLRQDLTAGRLTEEQFKARLREMMVEDEQGNWWMVGYETGQWYRHDGTDWVRANPPGRVAPRAAPQPVARPVAPAKPKPRRFWRIVVLLLGLAVTFVAGGIAVQLVYFLVYDEAIAFAAAYFLVYDEAIAFAAAGATWLGGLILIIVITRKVWRRK
jgi:hypothetical protein